MPVQDKPKRHSWDHPAGSFERSCKRCPAIIRKFDGQGGYQYWPAGLNGKHPSGAALVQHPMTVPECETS